MAIKRNPTKKEAAATKREPAAPAVTRSADRAMRDDEQAKLKALSYVDPTVRDYFKKNLGIDFDSRDITARDIYDIVQGKLTRPLILTVTPLAYDKAAQQQVEMPKIRSVASVRTVLPFENGKPVALDDKHKVFLETVPCRPFLVKSDGLEMTPVTPAPGKKEAAADVKFSDEQAQALEGIGINPNRLYGGYNHLSREDKMLIAAGEKFPVDGVVRTGAGYVNVIGEAVLVTGKDGSAACKFQPNYPEEREPGLVLDILGGRRIGALELDVFKRDSNGSVIRDANDQPMLNEAGINLITYGMAMQPVLGYTHQREFDKKENKWADSVSRAFYEVTVQNGNLYASKMKAVKDLGPDGKELDSVRWESSRVRTRDGKVYLDGNAKTPLEFASPEDMKSYLEGRGGVVKGVTFHDFKANKDVKYDAFVVADNRKAGFGHAFTPDTSKKLIEARMLKQHTRRRQNFGVSF